ncbi:DUF4252 domain-containing protein [Hymenobacter guriensis]|uniref:DUF4252 domain-containing protein n=1 Tax=Hymenobacter guriensis TaxID=2793065 RepID=A0ABS0KXY5_9BACT|nr:DUF4252 domain-containing protein [Hymenobacter guriensis]MBG8552714.1 DUF4252 domain-containing protein [Hymenobacter guriensis]
MRNRLLLVCFSLGLLWLAGCRAAGPEQPARTVAEFFRKYESRSGFKAQTVEANFATRLLLGQLGRIGGDNETTQAIAALRSVRVLTFTPTSGGARDLVARGLNQEVEGLLQNEQYQPLPVAADADASTQFKFSARRNNGRVQEVVGTSQVSGVPDSFVLMAISGNFTESQLQQLLKFLPGAVDQLPK